MIAVQARPLRAVDGVGRLDVRPQPLGERLLARLVLAVEEVEVDAFAAGERQRGAVFLDPLAHPLARVGRCSLGVPRTEQALWRQAGEDGQHANLLRPRQDGPAREHGVVEVRRDDEDQQRVRASACTGRSRPCRRSSPP